MLEYSGANLNLKELHVKGWNGYLSSSLERLVDVLATKAKEVHLEGISIKKLEGGSSSNITTLKYTGHVKIDDVSDEILSNIQAFQGRNIPNEKLCLLFKNLHTFKYIYRELKDEVVVTYVINNETLKNVSFEVKEETYLKLAANQVKLLDTCSVVIIERPTKQLSDYLDTKPTRFAKRVEITFWGKPINKDFSKGAMNERYQLVVDHKIIKEGEDGHLGVFGDYHGWEYKDRINLHTLKIGYYL